MERDTLPSGHYTPVDYECRQVFDIDIRRIVTEYRAEILEDQNGKHFTAPFPAAVTKEVQYGNGVKAQAVYLLQYQLIPYDRVQEQFELKLIAKILLSAVLHTDETGINIGGKRQWLHCISNTQWTLYYAHAKRGSEAFIDKNVLPRFTGILCHDHWKPYSQLDCLHALCNSHHLRELTYAEEQEHQAWAGTMRGVLLDIDEATKQHGGALTEPLANHYTERYRELLKQAQIECPPPDAKRKPGNVER